MGRQLNMLQLNVGTNHSSSRRQQIDRMKLKCFNVSIPVISCYLNKHISVISNSARIYILSSSPAKNMNSRINCCIVSCFLNPFTNTRYLILFWLLCQARSVVSPMWTTLSALSKGWPMLYLFTANIPYYCKSAMAFHWPAWKAL